MKVIEFLIIVLPFFILAFILYDGKFLSKIHCKIKKNKNLFPIASVSNTNDDYLSIIANLAVAKNVNNRQPNKGVHFEENEYVNRIVSELPSFLEVKNKLIGQKLENTEF